MNVEEAARHRFPHGLQHLRPVMIPGLSQSFSAHDLPGNRALPKLFRTQLWIEIRPSGSPTHNQKLDDPALSRGSHTGREKFAQTHFVVAPGRPATSEPISPAASATITAGPVGLEAGDLLHADHTAV